MHDEVGIENNDGRENKKESRRQEELFVFRHTHEQHTKMEYFLITIWEIFSWNLRFAAIDLSLECIRKRFIYLRRFQDIQYWMARDFGISLSIGMPNRQTNFQSRQLRIFCKPASPLESQAPIFKARKILPSSKRPRRATNILKFFFIQIFSSKSFAFFRENISSCFLHTFQNGNKRNEKRFQHQTQTLVQENWSGAMQTWRMRGKKWKSQGRTNEASFQSPWTLSVGKARRQIGNARRWKTSEVS